MVEFETLNAQEVKFGNNNFIEVARKRAVSDEGSNEFIAVSRGFFAPDGSKRFKKSFTIPDNDEVVNFIVEQIQNMHASSGSTPAPAPEAAPVEEPAPEGAAEPAPEEPAPEAAPAEEVAPEE